MKLSLKTLAFLSSTVLGIGKAIPRGQGTLASAVAVVFWAALRFYFGDAVNLVVLVVLGVIMTELIRVYEKDFVDKDRSEVVSDEWIGMGITMLPAYFTAFDLIVAFGFFRLFDIWKPIGVRYFDRHHLKGYGVMLDDVMAGIYGAVAMLLFHGGRQWLGW